MWFAVSVGGRESLGEGLVRFFFGDFANQGTMAGNDKYEPRDGLFKSFDMRCLHLEGLLPFT